MRKFLIVTSTFCTLLFGNAIAQTQLVNGNMEVWDNAGTSDQEPQQWNSFKSANCSLGILCGSAQAQRIERSTDIRPGSSGSYSARIYSTSVIGIIANGNLTTGQIQMGSSTANSSSNHNKTLTSNSAHRMPITALPDSIVFWAKFQPGNNSTSDEARMRAVLHDSYDYRDPSASDPNSPSHIVAEATQNFTRTYSGGAYVWQRFAIPFTYTGPSTTPAYMLITFTTNKNPGGGSNNDQVWIDDVELKYVPVTISTGIINPLSYTVSASTGASLSVPFTKTGNFSANNVFSAQLSDASGSFTSPTTIGSLSSANAGTISATIPAGTASGTGYRIRVISSSSYQSATPNSSDISINLASNSISPVAAQTIAAGINGTLLSVSETGTPASREWKFATVSGGPYSSFAPVQNGANYTPNFINGGTYYVVCQSSYGNLSVTSNEVQVNVVKNQITPAGSQSLLVSASGTTLTVTETPAGTAREWVYATVSGGPYSSFAPTETTTSYTPIFNAPGTYYVICKSTISGIETHSNEVAISVDNVNINTGNVLGSPFEFSASAPNASISVPFTVNGTTNGGNTFTAQLSDASGSFSAPTNIGTLSGTSSGTINATIPSTTASGSNYLIRVISSSPSVFGSDNGSALTVDQFNNSVSPAANQSFVYTSSGNTLSATESQTATSREWRFASISGGPYQAFSPSETGASYTPSFSQPGTYYVVCASTNQYADEVLSNEVELEALNGNTITTSTVNGSPFYVSPSANNQVAVTFTSDVFFNPGNTFTAQLSNNTGDFSVPVSIGSVNAISQTAINTTIPNIILDGTGYRIRVVSSDPVIIGTDNGADLSIVNFNVSLSSTDTQFVTVGVPVLPVDLVSTHPSPNVIWKYRTSIIGGYSYFNPTVTGTSFNHTFNNANTYQVVAEAVNVWDDTLQTSMQVVFEVETSDIKEVGKNGIKAYMNGELFLIDLSNSSLTNPKLELVNMAGQTVFSTVLIGKNQHQLPLSLAAGVYTYRLSENNTTLTGKIALL